MKLTDAQEVEVGLKPPPSIYLNAPFDVYKLWPYPSKSLFGDLRESPAQMAAKVSGKIPWKTSEAFVLGSCVDLMWIDGASLDEATEYAQAQDLQPAKLRRVLAAMPEMVDVLNAHDRACELREGAAAQVSLVWDDPATGVRCKGRPDLVNFDRLILADLKTARSISYQGFRSAFSDYNYHWQFYMYTTGLIANGVGDWESWKSWVISVRNAPAYGVACRPVRQAALELARDEVTDLLWQIRACATANQWPADHNDERPLDVKGYRYKYKPLTR